MNEENLTNSEHNLEPANQYEELSKAEAMSGVFTAPGETYEAIASTPKKNYWLIPVLIAVVVGVIATVLFMQDAELVSNFTKKQQEKMRAEFEKNVKEGKMTQEDVDKAMESMDPKGTIFKVFGYGFAIIGPFLILFILSIVYLVILKIMKAEFEFTNVLNVVGLAMLIMAVGSLIGIVLSILRGEISGIGLGLLTNEDSVGSKMYSLLSKLDVFNFWFYIVIGIGISKIAKLETVKSIVIAFIPFVLYLIITTLFA